MRQNGDCGEFMEVVYDELRAVAARYFYRQPPGFRLRPREIVHEAYIHLTEHGPGEWRCIDDFRAIAIHKMWQVVVDHVKQQRAQKRGGATPLRRGSKAETDAPDSGGPVRRWKRVPLERITVEWRDRDVDVVDVDDALAELGQENRRWCCVVVLHWFGGMPHAKVARLLDVSPSTAEKDFRKALAWLNRHLQRADAHGDSFPHSRA